MKRLRTNCIVLLLVVGLLNSLCASVSAAEYGSITIHAFDQDNTATPIPGLQVTLYYVAQLSEDNTAHFVKNALFAGYEGQLSWQSSSECAVKAQELYSYIKEANIQGVTQTTSGMGLASFGNLDKGLYLVVQTGSITKEFTEFTPFFVELPLYEDNEYTYNIQVYPKLERIPEVPIESPKVPEGSPTPSPTIPVKEPETPKGPIPQTGMIMWPIPIMVLAGIGLLVVGGVSVLASKKRGASKTNEK